MAGKKGYARRLPWTTSLSILPASRGPPLGRSLVWFGGPSLPTFRIPLPSGCRDLWSEGIDSTCFAASSRLSVVCLQAAPESARFSQASTRRCSISTSQGVERARVSRTAPSVQVCKASIARSGDAGPRRRLPIQTAAKQRRPRPHRARSCRGPTRNRFRICQRWTSPAFPSAQSLFPQPDLRRSLHRHRRQQRRRHRFRLPTMTISLVRARPKPVRRSWPPPQRRPVPADPQSRFASPAGWWRCSSPNTTVRCGRGSSTSQRHSRPRLPMRSFAVPALTPILACGQRRVAHGNSEAGPTPSASWRRVLPKTRI